MGMHVLILCTHNSARSVLAEGMLGHLARQLGVDVQAHSAGSAPSGRVNPLALQVLKAAGVETAGFRSKSWDEFAAPGAVPLRVVITVCDSAASETCPHWPGVPVQVHWGYPDPSRASGDEAARLAAFELTRQAIAWRMQQLVRLPLATMNDAELRSALHVIGCS
jgi:arsenate reductase (thioredoxin)